MKVHFIAIGGSAMHNLAIALHLKGFTVSGSDDAINEPSRSRLGKMGILPATEGWHPEKITTETDAVILGMHARLDNPELLRARAMGIKIYSYPEYIYEQSKDKLRVVIGGSHGKTTITSMILHVLQLAGKNFDYLVGAQLAGFDTMVKLTADAPVIIIEGDEYLASPIDRRPKFHLYKADIGVISGIAWDHINVFPTFDDYIEQFRLFIKTIQTGGKLIYCKTDAVLNDTVNANDTGNLQIIPYSLPEFHIKNGTTVVSSGGSQYELQVFGQHNLLNMEAARMVCEQLGVTSEAFYTHIAAFKGAARRLELLGKNNCTNIYKDFAHSPSKLLATIQAVKTQFAQRSLIACMELHTFSSLDRKFLNEYKGTLDQAGEAIVFIDKKTFLQKKLEPFKAGTVQQAFGRNDIMFFDDAEQLRQHLINISFENKNLLLMSSGNFGKLDLNVLASDILMKK